MSIPWFSHRRIHALRNRFKPAAHALLIAAKEAAPAGRASTGDALLESGACSLRRPNSLAHRFFCRQGKWLSKGGCGTSRRTHDTWLLTGRLVSIQGSADSTSLRSMPAAKTARGRSTSMSVKGSARSSPAAHATTRSPVPRGPSRMPTRSSASGSIYTPMSPGITPTAA
jgi:hypothetical protein